MPKADLQRQSGKARALRIRMDYFKQRSWLDRSRWILVSIAFTTSVAYGLFIIIGVSNASRDASGPQTAWTKTAVSQMNTGAISHSHLHFETDCFRCHSQAFGETIATDAWKLNSEAALEHFSQACQTCHQIDSHLPQGVTGSCANIDRNCVACHTEHQGRDVALTAVPRLACTQCHADLSATCGQIARTTLDLKSNIDAFTQSSHGFSQANQDPASSNGLQFRSLMFDRGRIRFDHSQHLNPGQVEENVRGGFRSDMLSEAWRGVYAADAATGLIGLRCQDCHQLQSNDPVLATATKAEQSHFYAPVQFDRHCAACHQMTFTGQAAGELPLPHASPRAEVRQLLSAKLVGGRLSGQIRVAGDQTGQSPTNNNPQSVALGTIQLDEVDLALAVDRVFERCQQCHANTTDLTEETILKRQASVVSDPLIPQSWLQYGLFDHGSHEKITNCKFCHDMTNRTGSAPNDHEVVMIKGPESCTPCHRSATARPEIDLSSNAQQVEWLGMSNQPVLASTDCTLCHRFHWHRPTTMSMTTLGALDSDRGPP